MDVSEDRLAKRHRFQEAGEAAYGADPGFEGRRTVASVLATEDPDAEPATALALAGRLTALRDHGNSLFLDLRDATGRIQVDTGIAEFAIAGSVSNVSVTACADALNSMAAAVATTKCFTDNSIFKLFPVKRARTPAFTVILLAGDSPEGQ